MRERRLRVVVWGASGDRHVRNLLGLGAGHVLAFDVRDDRRDEAAALGAEAVRDIDTAWAASPDTVVVATPPSLHVPLALDAARRGCNLFVEKPLADGWEGMDEFLAEVRARNLVCLV